MIALSHRSTMADPPMYAQRDRTAPSSIFVSATALPLLILRLRRLPCAPPSLRSFPSIRPSPPPTIRTPQAHPSAIPAFSSASTPSRSPPCGRHLHARVWSACRNSGIVAPSRDAAAAASMPTSGAPPPTPVPPLWTGLPPPQPAS